jgi:hypothetical protein
VIRGWNFDVLFGASSVLDRTQCLEFEYHSTGPWARGGVIIFQILCPFGYRMLLRHLCTSTFIMHNEKDNQTCADNSDSDANSTVDAVITTGSSGC